MQNTKTTVKKRHPYKLLNLTYKETEKFQLINQRYVGVRCYLKPQYLQSLILKAYNRNKEKFKDSHQAIIELKFNLPNHLTPTQIADKFAIPVRGINPRWNETIMPKFDRYILAVLCENIKKEDLSLEQIIAVCDLSARAIDTITIYGVRNYREFENFVNTVKPDIFRVVNQTGFGKETYAELKLALRYLIKYHSQEENNYE